MKKQRWEESEKRRAGERRSEKRKSQRKEDQVREKVAKSRNTLFFQPLVAPEGRKVGSLKRRVRSHVVRWEMTSCTPLWREAYSQVKMYKAHQRRTTFGSWAVEKMHAVVARSTFRSQNVQSTSASDIFGSWDVEKVYAVVVRSTFPSQTCKNLKGTEHFWTCRCLFAWQAQGVLHLAKSEQNG